MSIQVVSTSTPAVQADLPAGEVVGTESAPVAPEAAEQTQVSETDAEASEVEEAKETDQDDDAEGDESDEDTEPKESEKSEPKKKSGSQRRKERAERAEAEVARLQRIVEDMALKGAGGQSKPEPKAIEATQPTDDGRPKPEDFETHLEFVEKLTDWKLDQREQAKIANDHKAKFEADQKARVKSHLDRVQAFKEKTADYEEVVTSVDDVRTPPALESLILESENSAALIYELASNRKEFERICQLSPLALAREIGRVESRIASNTSSEPKPEPKKQTKAPPPIAPVSSKGGSVAKSIHDIAAQGSQAEYEAARAKQRQG